MEEYDNIRKSEKLDIAYYEGNSYVVLKESIEYFLIDEERLKK